MDLFNTVELDVHVTPNAAPCPVRTFRQANFDTKLLNEILAVGYESPTAIQAQAIPVAMSGYDVIGLAKTGILMNVICFFIVYAEYLCCEYVFDSLASSDFLKQPVNFIH